MEFISQKLCSTQAHITNVDNKNICVNQLLYFIVLAVAKLRFVKPWRAADRYIEHDVQPTSSIVRENMNYQIYRTS